MAFSAVLLLPEVIYISILYFRHEKVIKHGSIAFPIVWSTIVDFIFEEICTNHRAQRTVISFENVTASQHCLVDYHHSKCFSLVYQCTRLTKNELFSAVQNFLVKIVIGTHLVFDLLTEWPARLIVFRLQSLYESGFVNS